MAIYNPSIPAVPGLEPKYVFGGTTLPDTVVTAAAPKSSDTIQKVNEAYKKHFSTSLPKVQNDNITDKLNKGTTSLSSTANVLTGINTALNVGMGIYGAVQASKTKPSLAAYRAPIEPTLIEGQTESLKAAGKEAIDKSINTARAQQRRLGISDAGALVGKETEALNQLSAQLSQYRTQIDAQNAGTINQFIQGYDQAERQRGQFNAQTLNQDSVYKSQLVSGAISGIMQNLTTGANAIVNNMNYQQVKQDVQGQSEIERYMDIYQTAVQAQDISAANNAKAKLKQLGVNI